MGRVLGVDLGSRRIGLAISDEAETVATPYAVIECSGDPDRDRRAIVDAARREGATVVVVGVPLTLGGEVGVEAGRALAEVELLRRLAGGEFRVEAHDERLTTVTAERSLLAAGVRRTRRRQVRDKLAAAVMLQSWLDARAERRRSS